MIYAVIDTNVLVSAMLMHNKQSATFLVMEAMFANKIIQPIVVTPAEMVEILQKE